MENRKWYKNYLINGCRQVGDRVKMIEMPTLYTGAALFAVGVFMLLGFNDLAAGAAIAVSPFAIKINKEGLEGDNLKFVELLEKRISGINDTDIKTLLAEDMKLAVREATKMLDNLKEVDVAKLKELLGEDEKGVRSILLKQGEAMAKMQTNIEKAEEHLSVREMVKDWQTRNKESIAKILSGERNVNLTPFETRALNSPMTPANTLTNPITLDAAAVIRQGAPVMDVRRIQPTFWDYITKGATSYETFPWVNKKISAPSGAAAFIGPGIAKPGISFEFEVQKSNAKKVAVSTKVAQELLDDLDGMTSYITSELEYQLKRAVNVALMTGTLSATSPAGVRTYSQQFTTSGLGVNNPNNWDAARAVLAQIRLAFIDGPVVMFMNPIDMANMEMDKATTSGAYTSINSKALPGGIIVEDSNIPVGFIQAIALDALKTLIYKGFAVKFGWENDDFTKNLLTAIGEMRFHSFYSSNDAAAFVYDDFADIKSQIANP